MSQPHRRNLTNICSIPEPEDISGQIDRLNQVLQLAMQDIELDSNQSRVPSRVSMLPNESICDLNSPSYVSDDPFLPFEFEQRIEELLQTIDRNQMVIEDFVSSESRRTQADSEIASLNSGIELSLRVQKNETLEKERRNFEERLFELDSLKEEYIKKKSDVVATFEKLKQKESLLEIKDKELRASRMAFERHRVIWEQEHGTSGVKENLMDSDMPTVKQSRNVKNPLRASMPNMSFSSFSNIVPEVNNDIKRHGAPPSSFSTLESAQDELKAKEAELAKAKNLAGFDASGLEMQIELLKNKVAALRGEKVMLESTQATKLMSNIMISIQKQSKKEDESNKRKELLERMKKKEVIKAKVPECVGGFNIRQLEQKVPEASETARRFLFSDAPTPKAIRTPRTAEKDDPYRVYFENKKKMLIEKEKELKQRESFMQEAWLRLPGAKELIENINFMMAKVESDKSLIEAQRNETERERLEFLRFKERTLAQMKKDEKFVSIVE